ncbi:MAG: hypothetical protein PVSMB8_04850 [Vulcanimicrobiaceae bacterium]
MAKLRPLTPEQAKGTLAHRFGRIGNNLRQLATKLGARPYRVFLVWVTWSGPERGVGDQRLFKEDEILPTPLVKSLDGVSLSASGAGVIPIGSIEVSEINAYRTNDELIGKMIPTPHEDQIPNPIDFFYEVHEDGRGDPLPVRHRYRVLSPPVRRATRVDWIVRLERASEDRSRTGLLQIGPDPIGR